MNLGTNKRTTQEELTGKKDLEIPTPVRPHTGSRRGHEHFVHSYLQFLNPMVSHNGCLNKKVAELNILSQSLRADCTRYEQELCNALQEQEPLKQRCASLQAETAQHKIQKTALETTLESCKATIKQYEALLEAGEANEKPAKGPRGRQVSERFSS
ncbi:hypothetical protein ISCGN_002611 [Ixodes scapularis]